MPISNINPALFGIFAGTTILLSLKALFLGTMTAATRGKIKSFINIEDAAWLGGAHVMSDPEAVARLGRAHRNDLENLLPFFACGLTFVLWGGQALAGYIYCGVSAQSNCPYDRVSRGAPDAAAECLYFRLLGDRDHGRSHCMADGTEAFVRVRVWVWGHIEDERIRYEKTHVQGARRSV